MALSTHDSLIFYLIMEMAIPEAFLCPHVVITADEFLSTLSDQCRSRSHPSGVQKKINAVRARETRACPHESSVRLRSDRHELLLLRVVILLLLLLARMRIRRKGNKVDS